MPATIAGSHLGIDTHANRPAANAAGQPIGALYSCSTHGLIYKTDGSTWSTYATLSGTDTNGLVLLQQATASSSAQLDFTTFISATYDDYLIEGLGIAPATNAVDFRLIVGTGGTPTYDTGNTYEWVGNGYGSDGVAHTNVGATGIAKIFNSMSNAAAYGNGSFSIFAKHLQSTSIRKQFHGTGQFVTSAPRNAFFTWGASWTTSGTAVTALRFNMSSGNIATGTIRIYGIVKT